MVVIPPGVVGKKVQHKAYGIGTITGICGASIDVNLRMLEKRRWGINSAWKRKCWNSLSE